MEARSRGQRRTRKAPYTVLISMRYLGYMTANAARSNVAAMATTANIATKETVFDPLTHTRVMTHAMGPAHDALTQQLQFTSLSFFATALVSLFEFWLYKGALPAMEYTALATAIAMAAAGIFAIRLSREAFFAAIVAYGLGTALLLGEAMQCHCPLLLAQPMLIHAVVLRGMLQAYGKMGDLHQLENL